MRAMNDAAYKPREAPAERRLSLGISSFRLLRLYSGSQGNLSISAEDSAERPSPQLTNVFLSMRNVHFKSQYRAVCLP